MRGALLVAGATSDAGKSTVTAGLCRLLARRGIAVAPFKAQNMSNNSVATVERDGTSGEIGRAQATQAMACGLTPSVRFNPVLLKPGSDRTSQLVLHGRAVGDVGARDYVTRRAWLSGEVTRSLAALRAEFDVVVCEGAGSPAEINLRATDIANMGLARAANLPTIVVGDIDRGGVLAHLAGTVAVLEPADQALVRGFLINKFRGDVSLLEPGLAQLEQLTGRPTFGVLPYMPGWWLDAEDSLAALASPVVGPGARRTPSLEVAAIALPRVSNTTDVEALACEPAVTVRWTTRPADVAAADLVILPGTKATVSDLAWLRATGLADALTARTGPVFAVCGGYQMLGRTIADPLGIEYDGGVPGLGLLDLDIEFGREKVVRNVTGVGLGVPVSGYEIHHGRVARSGDAFLLRGSDGGEGSVRGAVTGTHWHGLLAGDGFRRAYLAGLAPGLELGPAVAYQDARLAQVDAVADALEEHCDVSALFGLFTVDSLMTPTLELTKRYL
ncbi:cobyric acid synthase [Tsukamurella soli]|uniref:Cobyric acid synthase n=1 Tax=Tsukamurella soli TaxID=644556 RepID=A0ABP8JEA5_9ACTN